MKYFQLFICSILSFICGIIITLSIMDNDTELLTEIKKSVKRDIRKAQKGIL